MFESTYGKWETSGKWEKHLIIKMNFMSTTGSVKYRQMHSKGNNSEIMTGFNTDKINEEIFESVVQRYQIGLETSIKGNNFVFDNVHRLHYKNGRSYLDSPQWLKNIKATINPKNNDDMYFKYSVTVILNHEKIEKDSQRTKHLYPSYPFYMNRKKSKFLSLFDNKKKKLLLL